MLRERQANTPWQRLRRNLLLLVQLLVLSLLILALARPAISVPVVSSGSIVVLLDASASMNATDITPNRFAIARQHVEELIASNPVGARTTLILVERIPRVLAASESDKSILLDALDSAAPTKGAADWEAAFALAAGAFVTGQRDPQVVVVSDGGLPDQGLAPLAAELLYVPIGQSGENIGITAMATRSTSDGAELFISAANFGAAARQAIISVFADGSLIGAERLSLGPGERSSVLLPDLGDEPQIYQAKLALIDPESGSRDHLALDDTAFAVHRPQRSGRTLLVSEGNFFLEQLLATLPGIRSFRALPGANGEFPIPSEPFDLYILDGTLPPELPSGNLLLIDPPPNPLFTVAGSFAPVQPARVHDHDLSSFVVWDDVNIAQAREIQPPEWAEVVVSDERGPLVFAGREGGRRIAVIAFDLLNSDLPLQITFPILFSNLAGFLVPGPFLAAGPPLIPGEPLAIELQRDVREFEVTTPSGEIYLLQPDADRKIFRNTGETGVYTVKFRMDDGESREHFAVNMMDRREAHIAPAESIRLGSTDIPAAGERQAGQFELWPWFALSALALILIEWWYYHRSTN